MSVQSFPVCFFPTQKQRHRSEARSLHFAVFWLFAVLVLRFLCVVYGACQLVVECGPSSAVSDEEVGGKKKKEMGGCSTKVWAVWKCRPTRLINLPAFVVAWCVHPFLTAVAQCLASAFVCGLEAASSRAVSRGFGWLSQAMRQQDSARGCAMVQATPSRMRMPPQAEPLGRLLVGPDVACNGRSNACLARFCVVVHGEAKSSIFRAVWSFSQSAH